MIVTHRKIGRQVIALRFGAQKMFHYPVLERMKTDRDQPSTGGEQAYRLRKHLSNFLEIAIDVNTNSLKRARGRILVFFTRRYRARDNFRETARRRDRFDVALAHDEARNAFGETLLAIFTDDPRDFIFLRAPDPIGGGLARLRVHAHVEGSVGAKTESAAGVVELRR